IFQDRYGAFLRQGLRNLQSARAIQDERLEVPRGRLHALDLREVFRVIFRRGHQLTRVTTPKDHAENFPQIEGMQPATRDFKPFILDRASALEISKALPKKSTIPILEN